MTVQETSLTPDTTCTNSYTVLCPLEIPNPVPVAHVQHGLPGSRWASRDGSLPEL